MDIRQLQYLVALAREKHFTRAAEACNVTQPTLSGRLRQLEEELGVPIVVRGQRYHSLTAEGERVLRWAQTILEDLDGLREELASRTDSPEGRMTLGVIPSALPTVPPLIQAMQERFPKVRFTVLSRSSREIERGLEDFTLDAGVTYLDNEPIDLALSQTLYRERYRLFVREDHPLADRERVTWAEASTHSLTALTEDMQNRRIIDAAFKAATGRSLVPVIETTSVIHLCAQVMMSGHASVLPEYVIGMMGDADHLRAIPLIEPEITHEVGLVALDRDPIPPLLHALIEAAKHYKLPELLQNRLHLV